MLVIRMRRTGSKKRPHYRLVVTEARSPREGGFIETLGVYNPRTKPAVVDVNRTRIAHCLSAQRRRTPSGDAGFLTHIYRSETI